MRRALARLRLPCAQTLVAGCLCTVLAVPPCVAQRYKLEFTFGSPEGEQLELIEHQIDSSRKIQQILRFLEQFPKDKSASYLYEWLQVYYSRSNETDKALLYGEKLLALHPEDFDALYRADQAAGKQGDAAAAAKWHDRLLALCEQIAGKPAPDGEDPKAWAQTQDLVKGLLAQREYDQFTQAIQADAKVKTVLLEKFLKNYPNSPYTDQAWPHLMNAYRTIGDAAKALAAAERMLARHPDDLDALLLSGQIEMERRTNLGKVIATGNRILQTVSSRAQPNGVAAKEWEKRKAYYLGSAYLMVGNAYVNLNNFEQADRALRQSLPYMKDRGQVEAAVLFYLGWANYHMERYAAAADFFRQCTGIAGPYSEQASRNLNSLRVERGVQ
ncbi:MAG: tetratricopeptide repeat protein [Bryobacterales bacterium]|nr:tetratricopeptide repeat protein [Bryobacterales bacterium]